MNNDSKIELNSIPISDDVVVDLLPDGSIFGIELLNANSQIKDFKFIFNNSNKAQLKSLNLGNYRVYKLVCNYAIIHKFCRLINNYLILFILLNDRI